MRVIFLIVLTFLLTACGPEKTKSSGRKQNIAATYSAQKLIVKVFYEPGAEPYTDGALHLKIWDLLEKNLEALMLGRGSTVIVPKNLSEMTKLPGQKKNSWSIDEVLKLSSPYVKADEKGVTTFNLFFLNGNAQENAGIIGFHINQTKIMAIFKDVIRNNAQDENDLAAKYVEQATIIHEMGHALGLVNNGLPMSKGHEDKDHRGHCSNTECVMYYSNEGAISMFAYIQNVIKNLNVIMFDSQCLKDAQNYQK